MKTKQNLFALIKIYLLPLSVLFFVIILFTGCDEEESTAPPADPNAVTIQSNTFNPGNRTVAAGTTIKWTNNDNVVHTVTSGSPGNETGVFDSGNIAPGDTYEHTFMQAGTFSYFCKVHTSMTAQVIVQ